MDDDLYVSPINPVRAAPETRLLPPLVVYRRQRESEEKRKREKRRESFKRDFTDHFGLDEERFKVNLVKMNGKWCVEIINRKSGRRIYQDYETLCNLLDIRPKLPKIVGANVDMRV